MSAAGRYGLIAPLVGRERAGREVSQPAQRAGKGKDGTRVCRIGGGVGGQAEGMPLVRRRHTSAKA